MLYILPGLMDGDSYCLIPTLRRQHRGVSLESTHNVPKPGLSTSVLSADT